MQTDVFNKWSLIIAFANLIVTALGAAFVVITLIQTKRTIRQSSEQYSYDIWRTIYDKLAENRSIAVLFGLSPAGRNDIDMPVLSSFLMILDMYANKYQGNYYRLEKDATLLHQIMRSDTSKELWHKYKHYFFSDPSFIEAVDNLTTAQANSVTPPT